MTRDDLLAAAGPSVDPGRWLGTFDELMTRAGARFSRAEPRRLDQANAEALVFTSPMGGPLRHTNFYRRVWMPTTAKAGLSGIRFHDLRHAGNALTAEAGASLRELMDRMGHSSTRAALIYLHSSDERQRKLADAVGQAARAALGKRGTASGPGVAREITTPRERRPATRP